MSKPEFPISDSLLHACNDDPQRAMRYLVSHALHDLLNGEEISQSMRTLLENAAVDIQNGQDANIALGLAGHAGRKPDPNRWLIAKVLRTVHREVGRLRESVKGRGAFNIVAEIFNTSPENVESILKQYRPSLDLWEKSSEVVRAQGHIPDPDVDDVVNNHRRLITMRK